MRALRRTAVLLAITAIAAGLAPLAGASDMTVGWITECDFSHRAKDDPIVFPGQPGASHYHDFYGNVTTNAASTYASLLRGDTTCTRPTDTAAYWVPTLYVGGQAQLPRAVRFYYRDIVDPPSDVRPYPRALRIVAGDASATGPQEIGDVWWQCDHGVHTATPTDCARGEHVVYHVKFPECWDGLHLDSPDHVSHMAESIDLDSGRDVCPRSHPVVLPRLTVRLEWNIRYGSKITLSSGMPYTLHADFFNSWHQRRLRHLVRTCIDAAVDCGVLGR
jgi:Domain of unknown function (DUF1996)